MKLTDAEEFEKLFKLKNEEWNYFSDVKQWKEKCLQLFNEACSLLVHAYQIDSKSKKCDFIKPKKNIYSAQEKLFNTSNNKVFDIKNFIKSAHLKADKKYDEKEDKKTKREVKISVWVELKHFSKAIDLSLEAFFEKKELKDLDMSPIGSNLTVDLNKVAIDTNRYSMSTSMPLFMIVATCLSKRQIQIVNTFVGQYLYWFHRRQNLYSPKMGCLFRQKNIPGAPPKFVKDDFY